jgi:hypothetical protein
MMNKKGMTQEMWGIIVAAVLAMLILLLLSLTGVINIGRMINNIFGLSDCQVGNIKGDCSPTQEENKLCPKGFGCPADAQYCCYSQDNILGG